VHVHEFVHLHIFCIFSVSFGDQQKVKALQARTAVRKARAALAAAKTAEARAAAIKVLEQAISTRRAARRAVRKARTAARKARRAARKAIAKGLADSTEAVSAAKDRIAVLEASFAANNAERSYRKALAVQFDAAANVEVAADGVAAAAPSDKGEARALFNAAKRAEAQATQVVIAMEAKMAKAKQAVLAAVRQSRTRSVVKFLREGVAAVYKAQAKSVPAVRRSSRIVSAIKQVRQQARKM
jgi:hypothetical protein